MCTCRLPGILIYNDVANALTTVLFLSNTPLPFHFDLDHFKSSTGTHVIAWRNNGHFSFPPPSPEPGGQLERGMSNTYYSTQKGNEWYILCNTRSQPLSVTLVCWWLAACSCLLKYLL